MRVAAILFCISLTACSLIAEGTPPQAEQPPPDPGALLSGLKAAAADSHFAEPIEVTDAIRASPNYMTRWMACLRSAKSEDTKRIPYSAFFNKTYVSSRYSVIADHCGSQTYHPIKAS